MNSQYPYMSSQNQDYSGNFSSPIYQGMGSPQDSNIPYMRSPLYNSPYYSYYGGEVPGYAEQYQPLPPPMYNTYDQDMMLENCLILSIIVFFMINIDTEIDNEKTVSMLEGAMSHYNAQCSYQITATGSYYLSIIFPNGMAVRAAYNQFQNTQMNNETIHFTYSNQPTEPALYSYTTYNRSVSESRLLSMNNNSNQQNNTNNMNSSDNESTNTIPQPPRIPSPIGPKKSESYQNLSSAMSPIMSGANNPTNNVWREEMMFGHSLSTSALNSSGTPPISPLRVGNPPPPIRKPSDASSYDSDHSNSYFYSSPPLGPITPNTIRDTSASSPQITNPITMPSPINKSRAQSEPVVITSSSSLSPSNPPPSSIIMTSSTIGIKTAASVVAGTSSTSSTVITPSSASGTPTGDIKKDNKPPLAPSRSTTNSNPSSTTSSTNNNTSSSTTHSNTHNNNSSSSHRKSNNSSNNNTNNNEHQGGSITASGRVRTAHSEIDPASFTLDIDKVENGEDKRTTLMIRNIPNKYKPKMLLAEIDVNYKGTYDFFYLPIDFKNRCNVGYAFINFIKYPTVAPFYEDFNNRKWNRFNSDKICEVRYGRIQGQNELISHFRNSSVMTVEEEYRPLLFNNDGEPQSFPPEFYSNKSSKRSYH